MESRPRGGKKGLGELGPLPGGHHGLSRDQIVHSQRERLLAAMAREVAEHGYREVKIRNLTRLAGVSSRDFYEQFDGKEACFIATFDAVCSYLEGRLTEVALGQPDWTRQAIAVLRSALEFFAAEPDLARLCFVEPISANATIASHFREVVLTYVPAVARGRQLLSDPDSLPPNIEDSVLGGILSIVSRTILIDGAERLPEILADLIDFTFSPFVGAEHAADLAVQATSS